MKNIFHMHNGKEGPALEQQWSVGRLHFRARMLSYNFAVGTPDHKVMIFGLQELGRNGAELIDFEIWSEE